MQALRNKSKYTGVKRIFFTTKCALEGLFYAYKYEKSLFLHGVLSILAIILGFVLNISHIEWSVMLVSLAVILAFELVNTAMEACVDMVTLEYHELAKIAKDCCGAATFVMSMTGLVICGVIFLPKVLYLLGIM